MNAFRFRPKEPYYLSDPLVFICILLIGLGFGTFSFWATTAQLAQGVTAGGIVIVENRRYPVQHLEGGIVQEVLIAEGGNVRSGDLAMVVSDAVSIARLSQVRAEQLALLAQLDRLTAQLNDADTIRFDQLLEASKDDTIDLTDLISLNEVLFFDHQSSINGERALVAAKIDRLHAQGAVLEVRRTGKEREIAALKEEQAIQGRALEQQLGNASRVNELVRLLAIAETQLAEIDEDERVIETSVVEAELESVQIGLRARARVSEARTEAFRSLSTVTQELSALEDRQRRSQVIAPVNGTVIDLAFNSKGGVVAPGDTLFEIVPSQAVQQVEVRFAPGDRDDIAAGRPVNLRFGTLDPIAPPQIQGTLETIAADATFDEQTGVFYYRSIVSITAEEVARLTPHEVSPGIPVEVFFDKGSPRTPLSYFLEPIAEMLRLGMRG